MTGSFHQRRAGEKKPKDPSNKADQPTPVPSHDLKELSAVPGDLQCPHKPGLAGTDSRRVSTTAPPPPPPFGVEKAAAGQTAARPLSSGFGGKGREWNPRPQRRGPPDPAIHDYSGGGEGSSTGRRWVFLRGGGE